MLYVSIFVELLRSRPALAVWLAALAQALLWTLVPTLFYAGPPGDVPIVLAVGHEFQLGTYLGPPLAFWLAEIAFRCRPGLFGVYVLSQICVVVTYWAVFALGRAIVGAQHAALAVLLMVGSCGLHGADARLRPGHSDHAAVGADPAALLAGGRRGPARYWLALAVEIGLLLLTTYVGLILVGLLVLFTFANPRTRAVLRSHDPLDRSHRRGASCCCPHLSGSRMRARACMPVLAALADAGSSSSGISSRGCGRSALILAAHAGLVVLVALVAGWPWPRHDPGARDRAPPVDPFARQFVYFFALVPAFAGTLVGRASGDGRGRSAASRRSSFCPASRWSWRPATPSSSPPARRDRGLVRAAVHSADRWRGGALLMLPWLNIDLRVTQPAAPWRVLRRQFRAPHRPAAADRHRRPCAPPRSSRSARPAGRASI